MSDERPERLLLQNAEISAKPRVNVSQTARWQLRFHQMRRLLPSSPAFGTPFGEPEQDLLLGISFCSSFHPFHSSIVISDQGGHT